VALYAARVSSCTSKHWATPANALTALRLLMAPMLALAIVHDADRLAGALFVAAVITDFVDGPLARARHEVTRWGALFDHAVDAVLVSVALGALAWCGVLTGILPVLVIAAFTQYVLDSEVLRGRTLRASAIGRYNGIGYYVMVGIPVIRDALDLPWPDAALVAAIAWILVLSTIVSMSNRAVAYVCIRRGA
jgi:CDP-diacylglycerol--glycerol-3-phosphate 3-phosphatidyltransferase